MLSFGIALVSSRLASAQQTVLDLDGHAVNPLARDSSKVVGAGISAPDCPVSSRYAPAIQQISKQYADGANFWLVYPDKSDSPQAIRKYLARLRISSAGAAGSRARRW